MANRLFYIIDSIEREQEHTKRVERVQRSEERYVAACDEAIQHGVTLTKRGTVYELGDNRHSVWFYSATNTVFVRLVGETRSRALEEFPESDVYDVTLLFCEGRFLK